MPQEPTQKPTQSAPDVRKGQGSTRVTQAEFTARFREHFRDPWFDAAGPEIARLTDIAWDTYDNSRKAPRTRKAGPGYADPDYDLSLDWIAARAEIEAAAQRYRDAGAPAFSTTSTSATSPRNTAASFIPARPASPPPCRSATGRAPAIPITRWARSTTG